MSQMSRTQQTLGASPMRCHSSSPLKMTAEKM